MILLCGIPSEPPLEMVRAQIEALGVPYLLFNQRRFASTELSFEIDAGQVRGHLRLDDRTISLAEIGGVYLRLMDEQLLPELQGIPLGSPERQRARALNDGLTRWAEITPAPARVVNRCGAMGSNSSKPYQAQLIRAQGFLVPETLITNDPRLVVEFRQRHGRVIYKSISGVRSIVRLLEDDDLARLDRIRWCPTQFQRFVDGRNVRVHTIGQTVFATAIASDATDYRYARQQVEQPADLTAVELPDDLAMRCVQLSAALGLDFAGIDLKLTPDGEVYCFEVNPCPAFSYYEANTGQPMAQALARYLAAMD